VVQLVGPDALQDQERLMIESGRMLRTNFLQQNGYDPVDASCSMQKAYGMLQIMLKLDEKSKEALAGGATVDDLLKSPIIEKISRSRYVPENEFDKFKSEVMGELDKAFAVTA
jgi:V/A-type H+-transporting ATPase subunit A